MQIMHKHKETAINLIMVATVHWQVLLWTGCICTENVSNQYGILVNLIGRMLMVVICDKDFPCA